MKLGVVTKQPIEKLSYTIDYSEALTEGDNLESAYAVVSPSGMVVSDVGVMDTRVRFWASEGANSTSYKVSIIVNTADGRVFQDEIFFKVKDI